MLPSPRQGDATDASTQAALSRILEGTAGEIGEGFFRALVQTLASALGTRGAWVTEFDPEQRRLRALAFWLGGQWIEDWEQAVDGTPCQVVVENRRLVHFPDRILELYPDEPGLRGAGAVSYMGVPLSDLDGSVLGHLAVMDVQPMPDRSDPLARCSRSSPGAPQPSSAGSAPSARSGARGPARRSHRERHGRHRPARWRASRDANESGGGAHLRDPGASTRRGMPLDALMQPG